MSEKLDESKKLSEDLEEPILKETKNDEKDSNFL